MSVKLLTEPHLEFLSLKGGYIGSSESTLVKMSHCWKSHVAAQIYSVCIRDTDTAFKHLSHLMSAHFNLYQAKLTRK